MKPIDKRKCSVVKPPTGLCFTEKLGSTHGVYHHKLQEAVRDDCAIQVLTTDKYLQAQIKQTAKKMGLRLVYGERDGMLYIKPITVSEEEKRLLLLLRLPRKTEYLQSQGLQLHIADTLSALRTQGLVMLGLPSHEWSLTPEGKAMVERRV